MKNIILHTLTLLLVSVTISAKNNPELIIYKTASAITIDGIADEEVWKNAKEVKIDNYGCWGTEYKSMSTAFSGIFKMTYNDKFIYLYAAVHDATPFMLFKGNNVGGDRLIIHFSLDTTLNIQTRYMPELGTNVIGAVHYPGDWRFLKYANPEYVDSIYGGAFILVMGGSNDGHWQWGNRSVTKHPDFKMVQIEKDTSYFQEWQFPIDSLDPDGFLKNGCFKFNFEIHNMLDSSSGHCVKMWGDENNMGANLTYGYVYLQDETNIVKNSASIISSNTVTNSKVVITPERILLSEPADIALYNMDGRLIMQARKTTVLKTSELPKGVYIVKTDKETRKFVRY